MASLDLLLRWSVLRLVDGNTQTLVGVTGMLKVGGVFTTVAFYNEQQQPLPWTERSGVWSHRPEAFNFELARLLPPHPHTHTHTHQALFELLSSQGVRLSEAEVKVFLPALVEKCGQPQPKVMADCRCAGVCWGSRPGWWWLV